MNKFAAFSIFFAGLAVLGSSAMAANGVILTSKTLAPTEPVRIEPVVITPVNDVDVDVALLEMELGVKKPAKHDVRPIVTKTAEKTTRLHFLQQAGRPGEAVLIID